MLKEIEVSGVKAAKAQLAAEARRAARADKAGRSSAPRWVVGHLSGRGVGAPQWACSLHTARDPCVSMCAAGADRGSVQKTVVGASPEQQQPFNAPQGLKG